MQSIGTKAAGWAAIVFLAAGIATGGGAQAATITNTTPVNGNGPANIGQDFLVPVFDSSLGTLTGASVSLTGQFTPSLAFGFNSPPSSPSGPLLFNPQFSFYSLIGQSLPAQNAIYTINQGNATATGVPEAVNVSASIPLSNLPLAPFNPAQLDFYIIASSGAQRPPGAYFTADQGTFDAQIAVTFSFTPAGGGTAVPEPASLVLIGTGLLATCIARSRGRGTASG